MARPEVIFFDVNETLLDLTPLKESVGETLGGRPELAPLWFTTLLQYSLVATVAAATITSMRSGPLACGWSPRAWGSSWAGMPPSGAWPRCAACPPTPMSSRPLNACGMPASGWPP